MEKRTLYEKLGGWVKVIERAFILTVLVEAVLIIVIGVASNHIDSQSSKWWYLLLVASGICYMILIALKTWYQWKFPGSIIEELKAKDELVSMDRLFERQKALNNIVKTSIQGLNVQTCTISNQNAPDSLCNTDIKDALAGLLESIVNSTDIIFDTLNIRKFEVGIYLNSFSKYPDNYDDVVLLTNPDFPDSRFIADPNLITDSGIVSLKSDLALAALSPKDLLELNSVPGASFEIQSSIRRCMNNRKIDVTEFESSNKKYAIVSSVIIQACSETEPLGAMFFIFESNLPLPKDIEEVLEIFNSITANFMFKYDSCVIQQIINHVYNLESDAQQEEPVITAPAPSNSVNGQEYQRTNS